MDYLLDSHGKKDKYYTSFEKNQSVRPIRIEQLLKKEKEIHSVRMCEVIEQKYKAKDEIKFMNVSLEGK